MTTTFKINTLERNTADGFVTTVHWTALQTNGEFSASAYGTVSFSKEDDANLIPYEELTENQVIDWVKAALGEERITAIDTALTDNITEQQTPQVAVGTPWEI